MNFDKFNFRKAGLLIRIQQIQIQQLYDKFNENINIMGEAFQKVCNDINNNNLHKIKIFIFIV